MQQKNLEGAKEITMLDDFVHVSNGRVDIDEIFQTIYSLDEMKEGFEDPITTLSDFVWVTYDTMHDKILLQNIVTQTHALDDKMQQEILSTIQVAEGGLEEIIMSNDFDNVSRGTKDDEMLLTTLRSGMLMEEAFGRPPTTPNDFEGFTNDTIDDEMLQNMLTEPLAEHSLKKSAVSPNDSVELCAKRGVDSQNLDTEQEDSLFHSATNVSQSDDVSMSDLNNTLPVYVYELHDEEYLDEPTIGMSLGRPIVWLDWMEFSTTAEAMSQHYQ